MSRRRRFPWAAVLAAVWLLACAAAWLLRAGPLRQAAAAWDSPLAMPLLGLLLWLPLAAVLAAPPARRALAGWPAPHRLALLVAGGLILAGHLTLAKRATFPLGDWQMFTRPWVAEEVVYHRFEAVTAEGRRFDLNPVRLIPSLGRSRFWVGFVRFGEALDDLDDERLTAIYDDVLLALARLHQERHPDQAIETVRVMRVRVPVGAPGERGTALLREIAGPAGGGR